MLSRLCCGPHCPPSFLPELKPGFLRTPLPLWVVTAFHHTCLTSENSLWPPSLLRGHDPFPTKAVISCCLGHFPSFSAPGSPAPSTQLGPWSMTSAPTQMTHQHPGLCGPPLYSPPPHAEHTVVPRHTLDQVLARSCTITKCLSLSFSLASSVSCWVSLSHHCSVFQPHQNAQARGPFPSPPLPGLTLVLTQSGPWSIILISPLPLALHISPATGTTSPSAAEPRAASSPFFICWQT